MSNTIIIFLVILLPIFALFVYRAAKSNLDIENYALPIFLYSAGFTFAVIFAISLVLYAQKGIFALGLTEDFLSIAIWLIGSAIMILTIIQIVKYYDELSQKKSTNEITTLKAKKIVKTTKSIGEKKKEEDLTFDIDVKVSDLHKHGKAYELNLEYYIMNKGDKITTLRDVKYYFGDPINKEMPEEIEGVHTHRMQYRISGLLVWPINLSSNETTLIHDFIPSYPLSENLKMEFILFHTQGETKIVKDLKINFK